MRRSFALIILLLAMFPALALQGSVPEVCDQVHEVRIGKSGEWASFDRLLHDSMVVINADEIELSVRTLDEQGNVVESKNVPIHIRQSVFLTWPAFLAYSVLAIILITMLAYRRQYRFAREKHRLETIIRDRNEKLVAQKERAEQLAAKLSPVKAASKSEKPKARSQAEKFERVSVLFADIQDFTKQTEGIDPEALLDELDQFYLHFDDVIDRYRIEKIKTIGDAYMCAGGLPIRNRTNPIDVIFAALEMQKYLRGLKEKSKDKNYSYWNMRIGIHTGPVVAEITGRKKISYDIWGDTVNIASRMESSSEPNQITISASTYELVKEFFDCEPNGELPVKYKGSIGMYKVIGLKEKFRAEGSELAPNEQFNTKFALIQYDDLEELILKKLDEGLPENLYYHNMKHTVDVTTQVELIGRSEEIPDEEMLLIKTAALFHDMGFLVSYQDHEKTGIKMARDILPKYKYSSEQIDIIADLIWATKLPPNPSNKLEEIMCDADLDYLGRSDFIPVSNNLFKELSERGILNDIDEWNKMQLKFLESHHYFTETARMLRDKNKAKQLEKIRQIVEDAENKNTDQA